MTARFASLALGSALGFATCIGVAAALPSALPMAGATATRIQPVADSDFSATKDHYLQKAQDTLDEWRRKLNEGADKAADQTRSASNTAEVDLRTAWQKTQAEAKRLSAASADQWERAKSSFEHASADLKDSWNRAHPDNK
jgi:F0F1-type ATP synthase membrane subunit b/b'